MASYKDGNLVVVELKRDDSGKSVELQAIKYAAYCSTLTLEKVSELYRDFKGKRGEVLSDEQAKAEILTYIENNEFERLNDRPRIILASREFRPEVTASVLWLRSFGIDISCVKLTPYEIKEGVIAFESDTLIPLPEAREFIVKAEEKERAQQTRTVSQEEYVKFHQELADRLKARLKLPLPEASPKSYYQIPTGLSGVHFEWGFHGRPRTSFGVELHFEKGNKEFNTSALQKMERLKGTLDKDLNSPVIFLKDWGKTWARLFIVKNEGQMTDELKQWAVEKMEKLHRLL